MNINALLTLLEIEIEKNELKKLGLNQEEIDGYFDYYIDNYLTSLSKVNE